MDIGKMIFAALIVCIINIVLKQYKPEYAMLLSFVSAALILIFAAPYFGEIVKRAGDFSDKVMLEGEYISLAIKIIGISSITQVAVEVCRDAGEGALGQNLEIAGKAVMLYMALPAIGSLFDAIEKVLP